MLLTFALALVIEGAMGLIWGNTSHSVRPSYVNESFTIGANWYPTPYIKYYITFEKTMFGSDLTVARPDEKVILFRTQVAF